MATGAAVAAVVIWVVAGRIRCGGENATAVLAAINRVKARIAIDHSVLCGCRWVVLSSGYGCSLVKGLSLLLHARTVRVTLYGSVAQGCRHVRSCLGLSQTGEQAELAYINPLVKFYRYHIRYIK